MLIVSSWSERFRSDIGFKGVSQVWEGPPAWYFWLQDVTGVFHLALLNAEDVSVEKEGLPRALFAIKFYPYKHGGYFKSFSFLEKKLICSNFFDSTNTPVFEFRKKIPQDLFNVAMLEITMDHNAQQVLFRLEALDILRSRYVQMATQYFPALNLNRRFGSGEIDRDLPALEVAYPLFDCLLSLHSNANRQVPYHIQCSQMPGFEIAIKDGNAYDDAISDIQQYRLDVCYGSPRNDFAKHLMSIDEDSDGQKAKIIYDRTFPCGHYHDEDIQANLPIIINRKWWMMAHKQYTSELASSCGCCG
jgi:hypothetical protein